jgi:predicted nucleotidyltransferase component of viral defense system
MISRDEIDVKSREYGIHTTNVERDYVFGWILAGIYTATELKSVLVLKGGNCLRKAYFEHTRFSNDLDFSTQTAIAPEFLRTELNKACRFVQEMAGVVFEPDDTRVEAKRQIDEQKQVFEARLYFHDFYGKPRNVIISIRMDVTEYDRIHLPLQRRRIIHPYSDYPQCNAELVCLKLEESLASKLKCLLQRRHLADLYDFVFWIFFSGDLSINRQEIVSTFLQKTIFEPSPGAACKLLLGLPFDKLQDSWHRYIICPRQTLIDFHEAVSRFRQSIQELFSPFPSRYHELAFFPPELRNPIMEAGSSMTLLRVTYKGVSRIVEPYALIFKRRKTDGIGQEYFYVYDRSGGIASKPGIKCLLNRGIQAIENTDEKFEPRWPVEISKAGEPGDKGYFTTTRRFSPRRIKMGTTPRRAPATRSGLIYVVECSYCSKRFERRTNSTSLREHKDRYGNRCYGRRGHIVDRKYPGRG